MFYQTNCITPIPTCIIVYVIITTYHIHNAADIWQLTLTLAEAPGDCREFHQIRRIFSSPDASSSPPHKYGYIHNITLLGERASGKEDGESGGGHGGWTHTELRRFLPLKRQCNTQTKNKMKTRKGNDVTWNCSEISYKNANGTNTKIRE